MMLIVITFVHRDGNSGFFCVPGGIFIVLTSGKHLAKFVE